MFLKKILSRNANLIDACVNLHQERLIPSNSYVIDIDRFKENAEIISNEAQKYNLKVFAMTKQIGRNPIALRAIREAKILSCVCVDMNDARPVYASGSKIGHLGHLVQVPVFETEEAVKMQPEYWTVYSIEKAREISKYMDKNKIQKIMLRIFSDGDTFYKGHEGGFAAPNITKIIKEINSLPGLKFAGLTTFPTQLFNLEKLSIEHTKNYETLLETAKILKEEGYENIELNAPGATCSSLFKEMANKGITQVEPGHGLTGTTPIHAFKDMDECPAMVYVSEVSHVYKGKPYCFGGGMYIDPVFPEYDVKACVGKTAKEIKEKIVSCDIPATSSIDYYGILQPSKEQDIKIGETVVFGFRAQVFVTRDYVVPISGISKNKPIVEGIYLADGREIGWPKW